MGSDEKHSAVLDKDLKQSVRLVVVCMKMSSLSTRCWRQDVYLVAFAPQCREVWLVCVPSTLHVSDMTETTVRLVYLMHYRKSKVAPKRTLYHYTQDRHCLVAPCRGDW